MAEPVRTFADALREARQAVVVQFEGKIGVQAMGAATVGDGPGDMLATLEARIIPPTGPADPSNPRIQCDFCPRRQLADACVEIEPGRYACEGCTSRWERETRDG